jgi:hypothetical protein
MSQLRFLLKQVMHHPRILMLILIKFDINDHKMKYFIDCFCEFNNKCFDFFLRFDRMLWSFGVNSM